MYLDELTLLMIIIMLILFDHVKKQLINDSFLYYNILERF